MTNQKKEIPPVVNAGGEQRVSERKKAQARAKSERWLGQKAEAVSEAATHYEDQRRRLDEGEIDLDRFYQEAYIAGMQRGRQEVLEGTIL